MEYKIGKKINYNGNKVIITAVNPDGTATLSYAPGSGKSGFAGTLPSIKEDKISSIIDIANNTSNYNGLSMDEYLEGKESNKFIYSDLYDEPTAEEIIKAASKYNDIADNLYKEEGLKALREKGVGANFLVEFPEDGFRKDNTVWFGTCSTCGAHVSSSSFDKGWTHNIATPILDKNGVAYPTGKTMRSIYACPEAL